MRKREIEKELQARTLQRKAEILYEWQRKDLEDSCEEEWTQGGGGSRWLASSSYESVAPPVLTVNKYCKLDIIRIEL